MATPIILDCDPGHDDAIAIMLALASAEVELLAVTAVAGNAPLHHTQANAIRVLDHMGRDDIPVAAGADRPLVQDPITARDVHGATGLDGADLPLPSRDPVATHAIDLIAELATTSEQPVTLVATGPLTNVALFVARHPLAAGALERVVFMGGAIGLGNLTPAAEFNVWADPEAARRVCMSGLDLTMVGLDVTHQALFTSDDTEAVRGRGVAGRLTAELVEFYARAHPDRPGTPIHDAVAVAQVIDPGLLSLEHCHVEIDCGPVSRGRTLVDRNHVTGEEPNVHVATGIDPRFTRWLAERIASLG